MILTPDLMAHGVWYSPQSYTESGAGGADLHVSGNNQTLLEMGTGIKLGWIIADAAGTTLKPQLRAGFFPLSTALSLISVSVPGSIRVSTQKQRGHSHRAHSRIKWTPG